MLNLTIYGLQYLPYSFEVSVFLANWHSIILGDQLLLSAIYKFQISYPTDISHLALLVERQPHYFTVVESPGPSRYESR